MDLPDTFFDGEGEWKITARFKETPNLGASDIGEDKKIVVRRKAGYAILVLGSVKSEEGLAEHENTINFVRRTLEPAGFDDSSDDPDIKIIDKSAENPKSALEDTIINWAKGKLDTGPAPLYVVFINHGEIKKFHMCPDILRPGELDSMLDELDAGLVGNELALQQPRIVILGMCFSGSFIPELAGLNRILISASAPDEFSIRGPGEAAERQGEQFVFQLFRELGNRKSLLESFQNSQNAVRALSSDRNLAVNSNNPSFPGENGQHPLLDDNSDGKGSFTIPSSSGDGNIAKTIAFPSPTNNGIGLSIARSSRIIFLPPLASDEKLPKLQAEVDEEAKFVRDIWMEVKKVADDPGVDRTSSMQHALDLIREPMTFEVVEKGVLAQWPRDVVDANPNHLFIDAGAYQSFF